MIPAQGAIAALSGAGVEFVVIGGVSAILHGSAHVTYDIDFCYSRTRVNLRRLADALAPFSPRPRDLPEGLPFVWDTATLLNQTVLTLDTSLGAIDLLAEVAGVGSYDDARAQSIEVEAFGHRFLILDLPALIRSKRAAGRTKDLLVIPELEALLEARED